MKKTKRHTHNMIERSEDGGLGGTPRKGKEKERKRKEKQRKRKRRGVFLGVPPRPPASLRSKER